MIVGFRDDWLRAFFVDDVRSRNIPSDLEARLFRKLQMIDDAVSDQDLRVNQQWRLIFRWDGERGEADGICLDDHSYR